eukprot:TRINITY_DN61900_c0_g1_i1.p1 TRINITY_DN61900_c0_g1~~TRINITY_DN61900_c0_g1_i1.p1  ORF type:complete len:321 (-),score=44.20 TRINITY_DN61900_c0_g1_i1:69-1031(-)
MANLAVVQDACLQGHSSWVTCLHVTEAGCLASSSRDGKVLIWNVPTHQGSKTFPTGAKQTLRGHRDAVSSVVLSACGRFALTGSWDKTLRLWDMDTGKDVRRFTGHDSDVNDVAFSTDNRQIFSSSRDKTVKLWNTLAECKYTAFTQGHTDWVTSVLPSPKTDCLITGGFDKKVKQWAIKTMQLTREYCHNAPVNKVTLSPDGSLIASGSMDGNIILADGGNGSQLLNFFAGHSVHGLAFNPTKYWLAAATAAGVKIFDLEAKAEIAAWSEAHPDQHPHKVPWYLCLCWSSDGNRLYVGSADSCIHCLSFLESQDDALDS